MKLIKGHEYLVITVQNKEIPCVYRGTIFDECTNKVELLFSKINSDEIYSTVPRSIYKIKENK